MLTNTILDRHRAVLTRTLVAVLCAAFAAALIGPPTASATSCDRVHYPDICVQPASANLDLDCGDIPYRRFRVVQPDPHRFDGDKDGIGCER